MRIKEKQLRTFAYFTIFIFAGLALTFKILEVSAHKSYVLFDRNIECAQYSNLVQQGYLPVH